MVQTCTRCVFHDGLPSITFDKNGICSYCHQHDVLDKEYPTGEKGMQRLRELAAEMKKQGKGKKYDCVIGVSGGCDSSYMMHLAVVELGLRPLAVHFDNTWNSKIAVENIRKVLDKLNVDLYTHVVDNEEFNDLARSFLNAAVPEIDAITDIALTSTLYMAAEKYRVKHILNGHSFRTEGMSPIGWFYFDGKYIGDIHSRFGTLRMKTFPNLWFYRWLKWLFLRIKRIRPLYYVDFDKERTKAFLSKEYGWTWYGGHHLENRYTAFNHYLLSTKYNRDLRIVEFAARVRSGQLKKKQALQELAIPRERPQDIIEEIKKRLRLSDKEFDHLMSLPNKSADDYKTYRGLFIKLRPFFWVMMKSDLVPRSFYMKYCFK